MREEHGVLWRARTVGEGLVAKVAREAGRVVSPSEDADDRVTSAERRIARSARIWLHPRVKKRA